MCVREIKAILIKIKLREINEKKKKKQRKTINTIERDLPN